MGRANPIIKVRIEFRDRIKVGVRVSVSTCGWQCESVDLRLERGCGWV